SLIGVVGVKLHLLSHRCVVSIVGSITPVAAWRFDVSKGCEVDIDDGFERVRCRAVLEAVWECCEPVGVLSLQCEQYADGVTPTLRAATPIGRTAWSGDGRGRFQWVAGTITGLAFGVAQCVVTRWFAASRHGCVLRYCNAL
ncbi:MAG TPA: hypothetical protein VNE16_04525, partial [Vicinamibacterales bacterium]|nr:hypothetical protein [Vicinamibacterales bacterium]